MWLHSATVGKIGNFGAKKGGFFCTIFGEFFELALKNSWFILTPKFLMNQTQAFCPLCMWRNTFHLAVGHGWQNYVDGGIRLMDGFFRLKPIQYQSGACSEEQRSLISEASFFSSARRAGRTTIYYSNFFSSSILCWRGAAMKKGVIPFVWLLMAPWDKFHSLHAAAVSV